MSYAGEVARPNAPDKPLTQLEKLFSNFSELNTRLYGLNVRLSAHADKLVGYMPTPSQDKNSVSPIDISLWDVFRTLAENVEKLEATSRRFDEGN